jgi:hypothetical protein
VLRYHRTSSGGLGSCGNDGNYSGKGPVNSIEPGEWPEGRFGVIWTIPSGLVETLATRGALIGTMQ